MAKKSKKAKKKAHKSPKRSKAAKRAYKKSGLHAYNMKRKKASKGKKRSQKSKRNYGKKHAKKAANKNRHKSYSGSAVAARARFNTLVKRLEAKGHDPKTAHALAMRASRMSTAMARGSAKHAAAVKAQQQAMANLWGNIGAAGHLAAIGQGRV